MAQITYVNKEYLYENGDIPAKNKVQDTDMNEIKNVVNSNETKELLAVTDTAPAQCSTGDKYFNTTTKLIYTATATNTWGSTGIAPTENTIYVEFATQTAYAYDGTDLISVGGGAGGSVTVAPDEPTEDTKLYIESTDLDFQGEIVDDIYSTSEIKTNKIWIDGKPIYRKVINSGSLSLSTTPTNVNTYTSNIDKVIDINFMYRFTDYTWFKNWNLNELMCRPNGIVVITTYESATFPETYITLEYTKTTD